MANPSKAQQEAALERLEKFSRFTDSSIGIPFTKFHVFTYINWNSCMNKASS